MHNLYLIDEIKCPACGEQHTITREFKTFKKPHSVIKKNMEVPDISYLRFNYNFTDELKEKIICGVKKCDILLTFKFKGNYFIGIDAKKL